MFRRAFRVTLHLSDTAMAEFDTRTWNTLMALDFCVTGVYDKAGTVHGEWVGEAPSWDGLPDTSVLAGVRGINSVEVDGPVERHQSTKRLRRAA